MKKSVIIISLILIAAIAISVSLISLNSKTSKAILKQNSKYEQYLQGTIYGTDIITLINKSISNNETNNVEKDKKGYYINNNTNSIQIDLVMITDEEKEKTTTYKMEAISKLGTTEFIKNFNIAEFKCTKKEYHSQTGQIAYIELSQQSEY